ncbi:MAG: FAD-binding protein [Phycisphaerae bacterium]|nr:FAD-binding protein [Phycisphaerae bacterium]
MNRGAVGSDHLSPENATRLAEHLRSQISGEVRIDRLSRALYATDASIYEIIPAGVVLPKSVNDVVRIIQACRTSKMTVVPRGAGTGLTGGAVGPGVQIDFSRFMHGIRKLDPDQRTIVVEPGVVLDDLNNHLAPHGLQFAPDVAPSNRATLGGMIANNSCGAHSIIYGRTVDYVRRLTVVLADGEVVEFHRHRDGTSASGRDESAAGGNAASNRPGGSTPARLEHGLSAIRDECDEDIARRFPKVLRSNGGYGLDRLGPAGTQASAIPVLCGSEGTLGLIVEATLDLLPSIQHKGLLVLHYDDLLNALGAAPAILEHHPAAIELIDRPIIAGGVRNPAIARRCQFLRGDPEALLVVEFFGESPDHVTDKIERLAANRDALHGCAEAVRVLDRPGQSDVWNLRKSGLGLLMSRPGDLQPQAFVEDSAVPPARLREYVERFQAILKDEDTSASFYGHSSVGCLHVRPSVNLKEAADVNRMRRIADAASDLALEFGGAVTGEHGDGIIRSAWLEKTYGPRIMESFRAVKKLFDPDGVLNPGKIVDPYSMTDHLRFGGDFKAQSPRASLDFSAYGGMAGLAGMCSGVGLCRQRNTGTMCPSFMATRDEIHTTRARANALRMALSDRGFLDGLDDPSLREVLDLCLSCKACKTECPTGVDMARLKSEYLSQRNLLHGAEPLARLVADMPRYAEWASWFPRLSNLLGQSSLLRGLMERWYGLDRRVPPPRFATQTFRAWFRRHVRRHSSRRSGSRGPVVYFVDTWTNYYCPEVGIAAVRVLEHLGYEVQCPETVCCGRPSISKGLLAEATLAAETNVRILAPFARHGVPIVGTEPSCILSFVDEYPQLLQGQAAQTVAASIRTIETFLAEVVRENSGLLNSGSDSLPLLYHGHCHQKAIVGTDDAMAVMKHVWGEGARLINSGCCGMAGSFGHEKAHYDVARAIGEERLFPAVRSRGEAAIAVSGFSCRHQIGHHTDARPRHLIEYIADSVLLPDESD